MLELSFDGVIVFEVDTQRRFQFAFQLGGCEVPDGIQIGIYREDVSWL